MKSSTNYLLQPDYHALEQAIAVYHSALPKLAPLKDSDTALSKVTISYFWADLEHRPHDVNALVGVKTAFENAITAKLRAQNPTKWATLQNALGTVLSALGSCLKDANILISATEAFNAALEVFTQSSEPIDWAITLNNLGSALNLLGHHQASPKPLSLAVDAHTDAFNEIKRETQPKAWALTMHHLGLAFFEHGKLLKGNRTLEKSVVAYNNALAEFSMEDEPKKLAMAHNNLGVVFQLLGEREENIEHLKAAIKSYDNALYVWQEQLLPVNLATMVMSNLASVHMTLATLEKDVPLAEQTAEDLMLLSEVLSLNCPQVFQTEIKAQLASAEALAESLSATMLEAQS